MTDKPEPVKIKGGIETTDEDEEHLTIVFPKIDQKYYIDIHPIEE